MEKKSAFYKEYSENILDKTQIFVIEVVKAFSVCYQTDAHSLLLWEAAAADPVSVPFIFGGLLSKTPPSDTGPLERGEHASRVRGSEKSPHTLAL